MFFVCTDIAGGAPMPTQLFNSWVVLDSLRPHGLQHSSLPCPSLLPRVCSDSCLLSQWCHPTISSSASVFSFCLQSSPTSGSFPMSWLFASGGRSIGASASVSVLPVNIQGWFPLGWTGWISLQSKGLSSLLQHHNSKASILWLLSLIYGPTWDILGVLPVGRNWAILLDRNSENSAKTHDRQYRLLNRGLIGEWLNLKLSNAWQCHAEKEQQISFPWKLCVRMCIQLWNTGSSEAPSGKFQRRSKVLWK